MTNEIEEKIRLAKAIEKDIRAFDTYNVSAAYAKTKQRISFASRKQLFVRYAMRMSAILIIPLIVSTAVLSYLYGKRQLTDNAISYLEVASAPGTVSSIVLPDQSKVFLNAGSSLRYPSRFTSDEREVFLSGEGYFDVQSDPDHPFFVTINNGMQVKAYGTKFNVNAYSDDSVVEASLESGCIDVLMNHRSVASLKPNELASVDRALGKVSLSSVHIDEKIAWKDGLLIFRNATLDEVVKRLSRRYNIDIVLHKETNSMYKFRATFGAETIEQILNYLKLAAPIEWTMTENKQQQNLSFRRQQIDVWLR